MNIIMPVLTAAVVSNLNLHPAVKIALVALAISPVPPLLPQRELKAAGTASYGYGLLFTAALIAIVYVPVAVRLLGSFFDFADHTPPVAVARLVLVTVSRPYPSLQSVITRPHLPVMAKPVLIGHWWRLPAASFPC
jgi:BASS family bile acid:Na+ symporter